MNEQITFTTLLPREFDFFNLFQTTGWNESYRLSSADLMEALQQSWYCYSAYVHAQIIGFGRIICDGIVHALILDLIVHPDFQGQGLGGKILTNLVDQCRQHRIRDIQLFSVKDKAGFYQRMGFRERPEGAPGMELKLFQ